MGISGGGTDSYARFKEINQKQRFKRGVTTKLLTNTQRETGRMHYALSLCIVMYCVYYMYNVQMVLCIYIYLKQEIKNYTYIYNFIIIMLLYIMSMNL